VVSNLRISFNRSKNKKNHAILFIGKNLTADNMEAEIPKTHVGKHAWSAQKNIYAFKHAEKKQKLRP